MTERPILFNDAMVRAVLSGTKTQTRRVVTTREPLSLIGCRDEENDPSAWGWFFDGPDHHGYMVLGRGHDERHDHGSISIPCPYGAPGDRLWVREAWGVRSALDVTDWRRGTMRDRTEAPPGTMIDFRADYGPQQEACFWRPSIYMPRWASRLTLEVTDVRVERVQAISGADARAEGVEPTEEGGVFGTPDYRGAFASLWDSVSAERAGCSWADDPWVWVVGFRRTEVAR